MVKQFVLRLLYLAALVIQTGLIVAVFIINYLSGTKVGVYRHVYTRKIQYTEGIYHPASIQWQSIFFACFSIILIVLLFLAVKKKKGLFYKIQISLAICLSLAIIIVMNSELFISMMAYPYFIIAFKIVFAIQLLIITVLSIRRPNHKTAN